MYEINVAATLENVFFLWEYKENRNYYWCKRLFEIFSFCFKIVSSDFSLISAFLGYWNKQSKAFPMSSIKEKIHQDKYVVSEIPSCIETSDIWFTLWSYALLNCIFFIDFTYPIWVQLLNMTSSM